jgi:hypothetical protein
MISLKEFKELSLEEKIEKTKTDYSSWNIWKSEYLRTTNEDLSNKMKATKLKELHKLLKNYDYTYVWADDRNSYRRGEKQRDEILKLKDEIGDEGKKVWIKFLKDKGMMEGANGIGIYDYERYYHSKMKKWGIKNVDELCPEDKKKFDDEVDNDWEGGKKIKVNMPEQNKSLFPEMDIVVRKGSIGYGDDRQVGERSLTAGSFGDYGNLYPEHLVPKWQPPTNERKRKIK